MLGPTFLSPCILQSTDNEAFQTLDFYFFPTVLSYEMRKTAQGHIEETYSKSLAALEESWQMITNMSL